MTDFETHPAGTADLVKRLRAGKNGQEIEAADRIEQLEAALTRANAAAAAVYEVAANVDVPHVDEDGNRTTRRLRFLEKNCIHALATPEQNAALDKLIAEAEARTVERIAELVSGWRNTTPMTGEECANAILYASKKGGV